MRSGSHCYCLTPRPPVWLVLLSDRLRHVQRLLGIDYISAEQLGAPAPMTHRILLGTGIPIVEGLLLEGVHGGSYDLIVLPKGCGARGCARSRCPSHSPMTVGRRA